MATLLALFFTCPGLIAQRPTALTLQYELARHCVSADVFADAYVEIDAQAMNSRWPWFVIAFSHATGTGLLADELHPNVRPFQGEWRQTVLGPEIHTARAAGLRRRLENPKTDEWAAAACAL